MFEHIRVQILALTGGQTWQTKRYRSPDRNTRSMGRCSALGVGLRAWRGERVLGVEAGELGSGGSSGGG